MFIEKNLSIQLKDLINYSIIVYLEQGIKFTNEKIPTELINFLRERVKYYLKEKKVRIDIIESAISSHFSDDFVSLNNKCLVLNKHLTSDIGKNILAISIFSF